MDGAFARVFIRPPPATPFCLYIVSFPAIVSANRSCRGYLSSVAIIRRTLRPGSRWYLIVAADV